MGGDLQILHSGHGRDLLSDEQSAAVADVHLHHVSGPQSDQAVEIRQGVEPLSSRNRTAALLLHPGEEVKTLWRYRFLTPGGQETLQLADHPHGATSRQPAMELDDDPHLWSHSFTDSRYPLDDGFHLLGSQFLPGSLERIELEGLIAARYYVAGALGILLGRPGTPVPAVGVGRNRSPTAPAQKAVHRLIAGFTNDVPQSDFNSADRRHHRRTALVLIADHVADDGLDVERIATQYAPFDPFVTECLNRLFLPLQSSFPHSG